MTSMIKDGNVRIVSDGTTYGTKVFVAGVEVQHVSMIHVRTMSADKPGAVYAVIEVIGPEMDVVANLANDEG